MLRGISKEIANKMWEEPVIAKFVVYRKGNDWVGKYYKSDGTLYKMFRGSLEQVLSAIRDIDDVGIVAVHDVDSTEIDSNLLDWSRKYYVFDNGSFGRYTGGYNYIIYKEDNSDYVVAKNGRTGEVEFKDTDAASVLLNTISHMESGERLYIASGEYDISQTIVIDKGITISGAGAGVNGTVFKQTADVNVIEIAENVSNVVIEKIRFTTGLTNPTTDAIRVKGSMNAIRDVYIEKFYNGIYLYGNGSVTPRVYCYFILIENAVIQDCLNDGITHEESEPLFTSNFTLINVRSIHNGRHGAYLSRHCVVIGGEYSYNGGAGIAFNHGAGPNTNFVATFAEGNGSGNFSGNSFGFVGINPSVLIFDDRYDAHKLEFAGFYNLFKLKGHFVLIEEKAYDLGVTYANIDYWWGNGNFKGIVRGKGGVVTKVDVGDYGGNFANYTPPAGEEGMIIIAVDTNSSAPSKRLYVYANGQWHYVDLT